MKRKGIFIVIPALLNLSWGPLDRPSLITDDRGILTRVNLIVGTTNNYAPINLSIKQAAPDWQPEAPRRSRQKDPEFEAKLKRFMRQSEERLVDWRRQREAKRG